MSRGWNSPTARAADGWLITGSRHGAYEDHAFIPVLEARIRDAFAAGVPVVGICFGHQIMAQALGGRVEKHTGGWVVGRRTYSFDTGPQTLNAWHQDQVVTPPDRALTVAHNSFCAHAALLYPGHRGFSVQAHPEFADAVVQGLIDHRGPGVVPEPLLQRRGKQPWPRRQCSDCTAIARSSRSREGARMTNWQDQIPKPRAIIWKGAGWTRWNASSPIWQGSRAARPCPRSNLTTAPSIICQLRSFHKRLQAVGPRYAMGPT